jgi:hypothetical protein
MFKKNNTSVHFPLTRKTIFFHIYFVLCNKKMKQQYDEQVSATKSAEIIG